MATIHQVQRGFANFVDNEISKAFDGWQKAIVSGGAGLLAANFPKIVEMYGSHPIVSALGIYNPESNTINIDAVYNAIVPKLGIEKIPITIPKIAVIKVGREEIDMLYQYIKEA